MLPSHRQQLVGLIESACAQLGATGIPITLERPKSEAHGDIATNVALQIAKAQRKNPREVAAEIATAMRGTREFSALLDTVEVAGPGFINLRLAAAARQQVVRDVLLETDRFGVSDAHAGEQVMVEFVSANPTGPLHLGHARQAALGDALANLLVAQGWRVTREFYYNDAGVQIATLALSVQARAKELKGEVIVFPETGYRGEYIAEIARDFLAQATIKRDGSVVAASGDVDDLNAIQQFAVAYLRNEQDRDLAALGVHFDSYFLESSLYSDGTVAAAVDAIVASGMTYEHEGALWLKTTAFGSDELAGLGGPPVDDKDRVMRKSDGTYTYFVPDVAYHTTKVQRGFDKVVNVQGTDHYGTVARVRAGLRAAAKSLGIEVPHGYPDYVLHKMLRVTKDGEEVKMSKRAGTYVTLRDLLDWVGRDATRFFLVSRKPDAEFVFDVDLAVSRSDENPVYYVQYAHARICSVLAQAEEKGFTVPASADVALVSLQSAREQALMNRLADYPTNIADAARDAAPHQVASYLKELSADFHAYYNAERVLVDDDDTRNARLALLLATRQVLSNGLGLLGVSAPQRM